MTYTSKALVLSAVVSVLAAAGADARVGVEETPPIPRSVAPEPGGDGGGGAAGYRPDEGGFVLASRDGDYRLVIGGRLQAGFEAVDWDDALGRDATATFDLRRARFYLLGHVLSPQTRFFVQLAADQPDAMFESGLATDDLRLLDAWIKHEYRPELGIKLGQFKTPFGRQNLTSSGKLQLPERALALLSPAVEHRDIGVELSGGFEQGLVLYQLAISNGDGPNTLNGDNSLAVTGRISFNPHGDYGYSEGDLQGSERLASTFGAAVQYFTDETGDSDVDWLRINLDGGIKYRRFSLQGELFFTSRDRSGGVDTDDTAYYLQGGYFVIPEKLELAGRASQVFPDGDDNEQTEISLGVNLFTWGHRLKWQAAYSLFDDAASDVKNHRVLARAQLWF